MEDTLRQFWRGRLVPFEQGVQSTKEMRDLQELIDRNRIHLTQTMGEQQKEILERYDTCLEEMYDLVTEEIFVHGFRLGMRFATESLWGDKCDEAR